MRANKMKNKKIQIFSLLTLLALLVIGIVNAGTNPSAPTDITEHNNMTNSYPNGTMMNRTRGYIYNLTISESQPSMKWLGYVGQIDGEYGLQDASGNALYDWDIVTVSGELYATKETVVGGSAYDEDNPYNGGMPEWANLDCANQTMINLENANFNHPDAEDAYNVTFTEAYNHANFYAGETLIDDTAVGSGNCFGIHLNENNSVQTTHWREVVLTDQTHQDYNDADPTGHYDLIYAGILENNAHGFDNNTYDFQMLLPQDATEGSVANIPFYFYVELV